jgi:hypothetical protein
MELEELRAELIGIVDRIREEDALRSLLALLKLPLEQLEKFVPWMESFGPEHEPSIEDVDRFLAVIHDGSPL